MPSMLPFSRVIVPMIALHSLQTIGISRRGIGALLRVLELSYEGISKLSNLVGFVSPPRANYHVYIMRTSYSAIETYKQCPQKYKFQEIDRIKAPKSREALFGTAIHSALKFMFQKSPLFPTLDEVVSYYRENWPSATAFQADSKNDPLKMPWTEADEKAYFEEGIKMLRRFYEKNAPWNFNIVDLESRFDILIEDEKTGKTHILAGIIDRIDKNQDEYEIIDYKTAKRMPSQVDVDKNLQLSLYSLGLQKRWPHVKAEDIKLTLYFVKHGEKLSTTATSEKTEATKAEIIGTIRDIETRLDEKKEFEPMPSPLCNWCAFKPMCPAWKHLYRNTNNESGIANKDEADVVLKEFFALRKEVKVDEDKISELQKKIREYMDSQGLTRVFSDDGTVSKKTIQRFSYDFEKIKALLSPIGRWEDILDADEAKLKKISKELPPEIRSQIEDTRSVSKEYTVLSVSEKKKKDGIANEDDKQENNTE